MIRFGILGTARIARALLGYPIEGVEIVAVASRTKERGEAFAREMNVPAVFSPYEDLLSDRSIDAVYVALPPALNGEYAAKAIEAGKHVLVEKPAAVSTSQVTRIRSALRATGCSFMEAFMYRFMKIHTRAKEIVSSGTIGRLRYINFNFCFDIVSRGRTGYRTEAEQGGGALNDLGIYAVDFLRFMTEDRPVLLQSLTRWDERSGVDLFTHGVYATGDVVAALTCSFDADANYYVLSGDKGSVASPVAISGRELENILRIHLLENDRKYEETFTPENPYKAEIEYFARCIAESSEPFLNIENTAVNVSMIEQLRSKSQRL